MEISVFKAGGGGTWRPTFSSGMQRVSSQVAGTNVIDVTAGAGQIVVLHSLLNINSGNDNYRVTRDGDEVIVGRLGAVGMGEATGQFYIGTLSSTAYPQLASQIPPVVGNSIQVTFVSGAQDCSYGYTLMELVP